MTPIPTWRWPLLRQLRAGSDGTGLEAASARTLGLRARTAGAEVARSVCPFCGVGCGQRVYHRDGHLVAIEGDPQSPVSRGTLCPKGSASQQLLTHPGRLTRVRYRAPGATAWTELDLDTAMEMVADRVWETRRRTYVETTADLPEDDPSRTDRDAAEAVGHTAGMAHLGGATLDNEENYLIKKLFTAGLGMVPVSNQARI
jgi:formate dehydrogenase major subunit